MFSTTYYFKIFSNSNKTVYARQKEKNGSQERFAQEDIDKIDTEPPSTPTVVINSDNSITVSSSDTGSGIGGYLITSDTDKPDGSEPRLE